LSLDTATLERLRTFQRNEITEYHIYRRLARTLNDPENRRVLESIADDEREHCQQWKAYTGEEVAPDRVKMRKYYLISRLLGFTFGIKLMERGKEGAQENDASVAKDEPFRRRFLEMAGLSLSISALSFGIGYLLRTVFGIEV
jgi:hypothetical protein